MQDFIIKIEKMRGQTTAADKALKKAEDKLNHLDNKHLFLMQEKTELAF